MRKSGILCPVFSLTGKYGIGSFSREAYEFVDFLAKAGQTYWQILPLGPTSYGDSPYQSFSTYAGNPYFIDLDELKRQKLLTDEELKEADLGSNPEDIDYGKLYQNRFPLLRKAFGRIGSETRDKVLAYRKENQDWVEDYALYMAVKATFDNVALSEWDDDIRLRKPEAMERYRKECREDVDFYIWLQYEFYREWNALKGYANKKGIRIIGDIPIYVSADSADVWAHPELFELDEDYRPTHVAGCPPDGFTADGQLWGNPVYRWDYHKKTGYEWWKMRIGKSALLYDVIRIDHFRGFDQYYSIPGDAVNARHGKWVDGPGMDLFKALKPVLEEKNVGIIAEDLGFITDTVRKLVKDSGFPNMKVLEFAFDVRDTGSANDYLPFNYPRNCVAYTGTHDNETMVGWLLGLDKETFDYVREFADAPKKADAKEVCRKMVRIALASPADTAIIPIQDHLGLDNSARINTPSTLGNNWRWRMKDGVLTEKLAKEIYKITRIYGRAPVLPKEDEEEKTEDKSKDKTENKAQARNKMKDKSKKKSKK
jgi:4-alpha-glucanotransferase